MNYAQRIDKLLEEGFTISIGPHVNGIGYFAGIFKDEDTDEHCEACDHLIKEDLWYNFGHGFTVEEALINAELITEDREPVKKYSPKDFKKKG